MQTGDRQRELARRNAQIVAAARLGATYEALGAQFGLSARQAGKIVADAHLDRAPCPPGLIKAYESGRTMAQAGEPFGLSAHQVKRRLAKAGVKPRRRMPRKKVPPRESAQAGRARRAERNAEIVKLALDGASPAEIAERFAITPDTAARIARRSGAALKKPRRELDYRQYVQPYYDGATIRDLAADAGVSRSTMNRGLEKLGVTFRPRGGDVRRRR